ncbi:unnamed protein product [Chrysoparadoxa australica]
MGGEGEEKEAATSGEAGRFLRRSMTPEVEVNVNKTRGGPAATPGSRERGLNQTPEGGTGRPGNRRSSPRFAASVPIAGGTLTRTQSRNGTPKRVAESKAEGSASSGRKRARASGSSPTSVQPPQAGLTPHSVDKFCHQEKGESRQDQSLPEAKEAKEAEEALINEGSEGDATEIDAEDSDESSSEDGSRGKKEKLVEPREQRKQGGLGLVEIEEEACNEPCSEEKRCKDALRQRLLAATGGIPHDWDAEELEGLHLASQAAILRQTLMKTVQNAQSECALCIGSPDAGIMTVVRTVTRELGDRIKLVYLDGVVHTDDVQALASAASQLHVQEQEICRGTATFSSNLAYVEQAIRNNTASKTPVVFVLEEFICFARRKPKSLLLYSLLNLIHSKEVSMAIIGVTHERQDMHVALEKRVHSRFTPQPILFHHLSFPEQLKVITALLQLPPTTGVIPRVQKMFREQAQELMQDKGVVKLLRSWWRVGRGTAWFAAVLSYAVGLSPPERLLPTPSALAMAGQDHSASFAFHGLGDRTVLDLLLLLSLHRLERRKQCSCSFTAVYKEYADFLRLHDTTPERHSEGVMWSGFTELYHDGLVVRSDNGTSEDTADLQNALFRLAFDPDLLTEAINQGRVQVPESLRHWALIQPQA